MESSSCIGVLQRGRPESAAAVDPRIAIEESKTRLPTMTVRTGDGTLRRLHSRYDPEREAVEMVDAFPFRGDGLLVVLGAGLCYHVAELSRRYPNARILVVEGMPEIHGLSLLHGRASELGGRARFLVGVSPSDVVAEVSKAHLEAGLAPLAVFPLASEISAFPEYYGPIGEELKRKVAFRIWDRLRYPKFRGETLTVALLDFGYFLTKEVAHAVKALGHSIVRVPGRKDDTCGNILGRAVEAVASHRPDFFLTINHLGFDEEGRLADLLRAIEMPSAIWYVDSPDLVVQPFARNVSPFCSLFVWDAGYIGSLKSLGFENVSYLPLAADDTVFRPRKLSPEERRRIGAPVGFVGNSMILPVRDQLRKVPKDLHAAVRRTAQLLCESRGAPFAEVAGRALDPAEWERFDSLPDAQRAEFEAAALWKATLLYRVSCLRELGEFRPRVRGDEGWKGLLDGGFRLGPPLHYYRELPAFYNACTVNFNATSLQMGSAVNQRVFDVPACGAFLLTDRQRSLEELFEAGKEVVTYQDRGEIADLVRFYLRNDATRESVAGKARKRVLREHTYGRRIETITRHLREVFG